MLTLSEAIKVGRLKGFVKQEEARGIGPAESRDLEDAIRLLSTIPTQSGDRTSRPPSRGGSTEK